MIKEWYPKGKKIVPTSVKDGLNLNFISLQTWIADDGGHKKSGLKLCTNSFSKHEEEILSRSLSTNLKISCNYKEI
jgi:hypothetical protein